MNAEYGSMLATLCCGIFVVGRIQSLAACPILIPKQNTSLIDCNLEEAQLDNHFKWLSLNALIQG